MSDTPRTDEELSPAMRNMRSKMDAQYVDARFARQLERELAEAREALMEISKGEGRYNRDQLTFACNCIEDMKALAISALRERGGEVER